MIEPHKKATRKGLGKVLSVPSHRPFLSTDPPVVSRAKLDSVQTPGWDPKSQEVAFISDSHLLVRATLFCPLLRPTTAEILRRLSCCFSTTLSEPVCPCTGPLLLDKFSKKRKGEDTQLNLFSDKQRINF